MQDRGEPRSSSERSHRHFLCPERFSSPFSSLRPSATPRTAAFQAPPSMGFSRQEYPWRREWQPTPVFLLGESHGQRSLVHLETGSKNRLYFTVNVSFCYWHGRKCPLNPSQLNSETLRQTNQHSLSSCSVPLVLRQEGVTREFCKHSRAGGALVQ